MLSSRSFIGQLWLPLLFACLVAGEPAHAEKRIALVVGNAAYQEAPLKNTANDAGLIAQTLQAAGRSAGVGLFAPLSSTEAEGKYRRS